jgi:hypothetical protein
MAKYVAEKSVGKEEKKWWSDEEETSENSYSKFLGDKQKMSEAISPNLKEDPQHPNKFADFETNYGVISIGADQSEVNKEIIFTILPNGEKDKVNVKENDPFNQNTYLGNVDEDYDDFKMSDLSFKYNFKYDEIERIDKYESENGKIDEEDELLYQDDAEEDKIEDLKQKKTSSMEENPKLKKEIDKTKDIKQKKEEENEDFFKEIKKIITAIGKGKIKKIVESDEEMSRKKRICEMSDNYLLIEELMLLLKKIKEKELEEGFIQEIESINLKLLTEEQLKEIIVRLQSLDGSSKN